MIRFRTLGSLDLRGADGEELRTLLGQPKRIALLAFLAIPGQRGPHRRDTLLALFWPEDPSEQARNSLSQSVHVLRRALGSSTLIGNDDTLGLDRNRFWCDAVAFEEALDAERPEEAMALYGGDLLEGFHIARAPEFERWLGHERTRLAARYAACVETVAGRLEGAKAFTRAVSLWRELATRDPYNSRIALRLMRALAEAGDPAGAIQHARVHETLLRQEMDLPPSPEIAALMAELQAGRRAGASSRTSGLSPLAKENSDAGNRGAPQAATSPASTSDPSGHVAAAPDGAQQPASNARPHDRRRRKRAIAATTALILALSAVGVGGAVVIHDRRDSLRPNIRSLAVLPLANLSGDSTHQPFADGMHDALIAELGRYPDLTVISRTSVLRYRGTSKRLPEIARELEVDGVVEGAVLRDRGSVRMTARLIHGATDRRVWAGRYQRDLRDVLVLQGELADAIAREVRIAATPARRARRATSGPRDSLPVELYLRELYQRGRHAELSRSLVGVQTAREAYRRAVERDSTFALGYAGLAAVYGFMADYRFAAPRPMLDSARIMARRAVELDGSLSETRTALAVTLGDAGEFEAAEREFKRAIELEPSNARAHYWYSILLVALGRGEDALREADRAAALDPFAPRGVTSMQRNALWLLTGQRPHLDLPAGKRWPVLKLDPGEPWARAREAEELAEVGRCDEARAGIEHAQRLAPDNVRMLPWAGLVYWRCGERARARRLLQEIKRRPDARENGFRVAILHTAFGEPDSAFAWLDHQQWTMAELAGLSAARYMDPLRSDPRFAQLLRRLGIRPARAGTSIRPSPDRTW